MVIRRLRFQAFTLIELLVVIAIIALLVSILVPSLSKARALAKRASCEMQMNGLGKASGIWVGETGEYPYFAPGFGKDPTGYGVHIDGLADGTYKDTLTGREVVVSGGTASLQMGRLESAVFERKP